MEENHAGHLSQIIDKSRKFAELNSYPSKTTLLETLISKGVKDEVLLENTNSAYPIIHHSVLGLLNKFLSLKRQNGSKIEKKLYKNMDVSDFITRLLSKRPLVFVGQRDTYILRDTNKEGTGVAYDRWGDVGTEQEQEPLIMRDYLTYDEGKLAALMGASTKTVTINRGERLNSGIPSEKDDYEKLGVIVGLVGPRMNKNTVMESQELRVTEEQNTKEKGYGKNNNNGVLKLFADFYGIGYLPKFSELHNDVQESKSLRGLVSRFFNFKKDHQKDNELLKVYREMTGRINTPEFLHIPGYNQRNRITFETLLADANYRALRMKKKAYVHVVGLGLGVWRIFNDQINLFLSEFIRTASRLNFDNISDIDFSWILNHGEQVVKMENGVQLKDGDTIPKTEIKIHISKRNPWDKLNLQDQDKLVVASWAWDGMSFVGNEYWAGSLSSSSDPAAACCTQIPELLNPFVNPAFCGKNTKVVTENGILEPIKTFSRSF